MGRAFTQYLGAKSVVGGDIRLSTPELKAAFARGCQALGAEVIDIGLCGTEEVYFATSALGGWGLHGHGQPQPHQLQRHEAGAEG